MQVRRHCHSGRHARTGLAESAHKTQSHEPGASKPGSSHSQAAAADSNGSGQVEKHVVHWGYAGANGAKHWGELSPDWRLCGSGKRQSPINIDGSGNADLYKLGFRYDSVPLRVVNNGHTVKIDYGTRHEESVAIGGKEYPIKTKPSYASELHLGDVAYRLLQFHVHTPSEHVVAGEPYPMEVHLVHQNAGGNLAVVGIFFKHGNTNSTVQKVLDHVSTQVNDEQVAEDVRINANDLLPRDTAVFHYSGSLTTPPCSENVNWFVMQTPNRGIAVSNRPALAHHGQQCPSGSTAQLARHPVFTLVGLGLRS